MTASEAALPAQAIAVTGMSCRFPGAADPEQFWENLRAGVESIRFHSLDDLRAEGYEDQLLNDPQFVPANGELDGSGLFDAAYFGYSPREAELMDPQHRLFLECAAEALERANVVPLPNLRVAVVGGAGTSSYLLRNVLAHPELIEAAGPRQVALGNDKDYLATRVAYKLGLTGPAFTVQTACSTSLVAAHLACRMLLTYEADVALIGGANVGSPQRRGHLHTKGGIASPDGHCRAFDARAEGLAAGCGVGVVVLRRLEDAVRSGDVIHATILGSAINNDGAAKVGFTAPSIARQADVIAEALELAEVRPETIGYVEAHGTATALGDPVEVAALTRAYRRSSDATGYCALGSVKTNFGHLDAAAGVAGLIKAVLSLEHGEVPPSLHFHQPNPQIDFDGSPFFVNTACRPWPLEVGPRRAAVSSFGLGGTNAHVVLQEAPPAPPSGPSPWPQLLMLSAKTPSALATARTNLARHLRRHPDLALADVAHTLRTGRRALPYRHAVVVESHADAADALDRPGPDASAAESRPVAFLFPGVSAVPAGIARDLHARYPVFRAAVDDCARDLTPILGADPRAHLCAAEVTASSEQSPLLSACATFTVEYALAKLMISWGVSPQAMVGHSMGEYVAACIAGVLRLPDALALVTLRYRLLQRQPAGAMISVPLPAKEVAALLTGNLAVAARNAPGSTLVSGPDAGIEALTALLAERDVEPIRLPVQVATHSPMLDPLLDEFAAGMAEIPLAPPTLPYVSSLTGDWADADQVTDPAYWVRQFREPVRFADAMTTVAGLGEVVHLEVGPGQGLTTLVRMQDESRPVTAIALLPTRSGSRPPMASLLAATGRLWCAGTGLGGADLAPGESRRHVQLPTHPFDRRHYWLDPDGARPAAATPAGAAEAYADPSHWFTAPSWRRRPLVGTPADALTGTCWLVLAGRRQHPASVLHRLEESGAQVAVVYEGQTFTAEPGRYTIDASRPEDYRRLFDALRDDGLTPAHVLHLCAADPLDGCAGTVDAFERAQRTGFAAVLSLCQALDEADPPAPVTLWLVTDGLFDVTGAEALRPEQATLLGAARVLPQEYPHLRTRLVDVASGPTASADVIGQLVAELNGAAGEPVVALRGRHRWSPAHERIRLPAGGAPVLRQGGLYLVTGGLDEHGVTLARHLVGRYAAQVVAIEAWFPAEQEWDAWLADHAADDPVSRRIRAIRGLAGDGGGVAVQVADVAAEDSMRQVLAAVVARFGPVHGVFHTAGLREERDRYLVRNVTTEVRHEHFRGRAHSSLALAAALAEHRPDFCLVQGTLSAHLGGLGRVLSAGANAFVDALAQALRRDGRNWITSAWDDGQYDAMGGAPVDSSAPARAPFDPAEIGEVVERLLSAGGPGDFLVSKRDLDTRITHWVHQAGAGADDVRPAEPTHPRPDVDTEYEKPRNEIEAEIVGIWQEVLGVSPLGIHDDFFALGGHSLMGTQIVARLRRAFDIDFPLRDLFEAATVAKMAERVVQIQATAADDLELERLLADLEGDTGGDDSSTDGRDPRHGVQG